MVTAYSFHMKLRQIPEDFIVEEINDIKIEKEGNYKLFLLEKKGIETFYFFRLLANQNKIPEDEFGVAGIKDKHAITRQYFTIPLKYSINEKYLRQENCHIKFVGYTNEPLKPGSLVGNKFEINVRAIAKGEIDGIIKKTGQLKKFGVPNYFDSQRFSGVNGNEFIA